MPQQPHHFDIAQRFALETPARLHPIEVAVNIQLQERCRMIARPSCRLRQVKTKIRKIKLLDEHINHTNRVIVVNPVFKSVP